MKSFQIDYNNIDVEKITEEIKSRIKEKRDSGVYEELLEKMLDEKYSVNKQRSLYNDISTLKELSKVSFDHHFSSHRLLFGGFVIFLKKIFLSLYKIALKPIYQRQEFYNTLVVTTLQRIIQKLDENDHR